jgi:uncharacterized protein (DUF4415 family)
LARIDRTKEADIDYSDIPPHDQSFFCESNGDLAPAKQQLTIRLDTDVLQRLKAYGRGYQTRINRILRAALDGPPARHVRSTATRKKSNGTRATANPRRRPT